MERMATVKTLKIGLGIILRIAGREITAQKWIWFFGIGKCVTQRETPLINCCI